MKKFLGFISLIYSIIVIYVWVFDKIKYYLSPTLSIYLKISLIPLIIISIVLLFNNKINYKFKPLDLILLLPVIMIFLSGNGRLNYTLASNRMLTTEDDTLVVENIKEDKIETNEETKILEEENDIESNIDFTNVDFEVVDESYSYLTSYFSNTKYPEKHEGQKIRLRGFIVKSKYLPSGYFAVGKYEISCCAADAGLVGFVSRYDKEIEEGTWVEIEGILEVIKSSTGKNMVGINIINMKKIDENSEEIYVYPCYAYDDDGSCKVIMSYTLY